MHKTIEHLKRLRGPFNHFKQLNESSIYEQCRRNGEAWASQNRRLGIHCGDAYGCVEFIEDVGWGMIFANTPSANSPQSDLINDYHNYGFAGFIDGALASLNS